MSASRFLGVCLLRRLFAVVTPVLAGTRFIRLRGRTPGLKRSRIILLLATVTRHLAAFLCSVRTRRRRRCARRSSTPLTQSHGTSLDEFHGAAQQTPEQTAQSVTPLVLFTGEIGQCTTRLPRVIVVVIHLQNSPVLRRRKWSVTVTLPDSNGTNRPVSSLILISIDLKWAYKRGT